MDGEHSILPCRNVSIVYVFIIKIAYKGLLQNSFCQLAKSTNIPLHDNLKQELSIALLFTIDSKVRY